MKRQIPQTTQRLIVLLLCIFGVFLPGGCPLISSANQNPIAGADLTGPVFLSTDSGITWTTISNGIAGQIVHVLAIDPQTPQTLYAGTDRGVFKTTDGGNQWQNSPGVITLYRIHGLAVDPLNPANVYAIGSGAGGTYFFKSADAGRNWKPILFPVSTTTFDSLLINPKNPTILYVRNGFSVYKSSDSGEHWLVVHTSPDTDDVLYFSYLTIDPLTPSTLYTISSNSFYKTTDDGATWLEIRDRIPSTVIEFTAYVIVDPADSSIVYETNFNNFSDNLYKSSDSGETWALMPNKNSLPIVNLTIAPAAPSALYTTVISFADHRRSLFKSTDAGSNWVQTGLSSVGTIFNTSIIDMFDLQFDPTNPSIVYAASNGGVQSTDVPWIRKFAVEGNKLFVYGESFDKGATILLNGEEQVTKNDKTSTTILLIGKTAGKKVTKHPDTRIQVRNDDGKLSQEVTIWPPLN